MHASYKPPPHPHSPEGNFEEGLEAGQSRYKSYLMWLGWVGVNCGWLWETEPLRIPSTRGWGIVGKSSQTLPSRIARADAKARNRWAGTSDELEACRRWALEQVIGVRERGEFKIRIKEGKEH
jgi:tRNASer (uridine44-2'-O)-methyltransferase